MKKIIFLFIVLLSFPVIAESSNKATLYRVEEGTFELNEGQTIDLTDKRVLLAFRRGRRCLEIVINGNEDCMQVGKRYDLKWKHAPFHLGKLFRDRRECFLDIIGLSNPKGAKAVASFRLYCG